MGLWIGGSAIAVSIVFGILQLRRKITASTTSSFHSPGAFSRVEGDQTVVGQLNLNLAVAPSSSSPGPSQVRGDQPAEKEHEDGNPERHVETICDEIVEVPSGSIQARKFRLEKGDLVTGMAQEIDGYPFHFYVMAEHNYARFLDGEDVTTHIEEEDVASMPIRFRVPRSGMWAFVFTGYAKQLDREIHLEVRRA